jgi:hypothetical protein
MRQEDAAVARDAARVTLWAVLGATLGGPLAWAAHLGLCYVLVAAGCTTGREGAARAGILVATLLLAGAALAAAAASLRRWRAVARGRDWSEALNDPHGHGVLLWLAGVVLGVIFTLAIMLGGVSPLVLPLCTPGGVA